MEDLKFSDSEQYFDAIELKHDITNYIRRQILASEDHKDYRRIKEALFTLNRGGDLRAVSQKPRIFLGVAIPSVS